MIELAAYKLLIDDQAVLGIVKDRGRPRIYHDVKPQDVHEPCIVIQTPDIDWQHTHDGAAGWASGLVRVNAFANDKRASIDLAAACRSALDDTRDQQINGVHVGRLEVVRQAGIPRAPYKGKQRPVFGQLLDCDFIIKETS